MRDRIGRGAGYEFRSPTRWRNRSRHYRNVGAGKECPESGHRSRTPTASRRPLSFLIRPHDHIPREW